MASPKALRFAAQKLKDESWLRAAVVENWIGYIVQGDDGVYAVSGLLLGRGDRTVPAPRVPRFTSHWPSACRILAGWGREREADAEKRGE